MSKNKKTSRWPFKLQHAGIAVVALLIGAGLYVALRENPVPVDTHNMERGPMRVTVDEEGVTEVRDVYTLSSPIAGHLDRTALKAGDAVQASKTVVASIHPLDPAFLDQRTIRALQAARAAANSAVVLAESQLERAKAGLSLARAEYGRATKLAVDGTISQSELERSESEFRLQQAQVHSAEANVQLAGAELESAEARLEQPQSGQVTQNQELDSVSERCCIDIVSPIDGVVLAMKTRSEQVVGAGAVIAELGDPSALQVRIDLLSSDAVRVKPGAMVEIRDWGGDEELIGHIERIEPGAFTRVSALGIEEQRVNVIITLDVVPAALGHGYRVFGRLSVWSSEDVLQVPISALFRHEGLWAVFTADGDVARLKTLEIEHMNSTHAEVIDGIEANERVILYPSDLVVDGALVSERGTGDSA